MHDQHSGIIQHMYCSRRVGVSVGVGRLISGYLHEPPFTSKRFKLFPNWLFNKYPFLGLVVLPISTNQYWIINSYNLLSDPFTI